MTTKTRKTKKTIMVPVELVPEIAPKKLTVPVVVRPTTLIKIMKLVEKAIRDNVGDIKNRAGYLTQREMYQLLTNVILMELMYSDVFKEETPEKKS